jgi:hypothetical protein
MISWLLRERVLTRSVPACDALRGACSILSVGGMRAVLGQWAGGSLPLPQAKAPSTLGRCVILFRPESCYWDSGYYVLRVRVGRGHGRLHCWVCTPSRKIQVQFQGYKHTSLTSLVGEPWEIGPLWLRKRSS